MTSETSSLTKDMAAYENMRSSLETDYLGKWVVVHELCSNLVYGG